MTSANNLHRTLAQKIEYLLDQERENAEWVEAGRQVWVLMNPNVKEK